MNQQHDQLVNTIITYAELLSQSKTPCVATWKPFFISTCTDWCLYIETELAILSNEETDHVLQLVQKKKGLHEIPPLSVLLDALHTLFYTLIQNVYLSNTLYLYLMKNYRFLTMPEENDILQKDLATLANKAAIENILSDILEELSSL